MMWKFAPLALAGLVAACGGNPLSFDGPVTEPPPETEPPEIDEPAQITGVQVPAVIAHNLRAANYTPGAPTIRIDLLSLDGTPKDAVYTRRADLDMPGPLPDTGYEAYVVQESDSHRSFIALFKRVDSAEAGVVGDGGQFGSYFAGATYRQLQPFTLPTPASLGRTSLLATYTGGYVGLLNGGPDVPYPGAHFDPSKALRVNGEFMMNADYNAENLSIEGGVRNRVISDPNTLLPTGTLGGVNFKVTQITPDGAFSGNVHYAVPGDDYDTAMGHYSGVIGGQGTSVAGGTKFNPVIGEDRIVEHGAFVGNLCSTPGAPASPGTAQPVCPSRHD